MQIPDLINGSFECFGGTLLCINIYRLLRDKQVRGISLIPVIFFTLWGYWNLFYYPHLNQWVSFFGGILVVLANTMWVLMAIYYKRNPKGKNADEKNRR